MLINVSDLYDSFFDTAQLVWSRFALGPDTDPPLQDFLDQLEVDLFLPACARRVEQLARRSIDADDVARFIRLRERDRTTRAGAAGRYHGHAFEPAPDDGALRNLVLAGNMMARDRADVELVITVTDEDTAADDTAADVPGNGEAAQ
jgi:hypothetical protein